MTKLMMIVGSTVGSWIGWWVGDHLGFMTAFILSIVGLALGTYGGRRVADTYGY